MSPDTPRTRVFARLINEPRVYVKQYLDRCEKYNSVEEIYSEVSERVEEKVKTLAENEHYKYKK